MNSFDTQLNSLLNETYFGGSPYERKTRIKRHITFEQTGEDPRGVIGQTLDAIDNEALSPKALALVDLVRAENVATSRGARVTGASTDASSKIRSKFLKSFGNTKVTVYSDDNNVYHRETKSAPTIIWTSPERSAGEEEQYDRDGLQITAYHYLPTGGTLAVTRDIGKDRYKIVHTDDNGVVVEDSIPATLSVKDLVGKVTVEVSAKSTSVDLPRSPFIVFYDEF
jgi:hypothetical protein